MPAIHGLLCISPKRDELVEIDESVEQSHILDSSTIVAKNIVRNFEAEVSRAYKVSKRF